MTKPIPALFEPDATEHRAVVSWPGPGTPIVLTVYGPDGEIAVPLLPKRALTLAQELLTCAVQAVKADPNAPWAPAEAAAGGDRARMAAYPKRRDRAVRRRERV